MTGGLADTHRQVRLHRPLLLGIALALVATGCGSSSQEGTEPPPAASIEHVDALAPTFPPGAISIARTTPGRLLARLRLDKNENSLFLGDWPSDGTDGGAACYFFYVAANDAPDEADPIQALCDRVSKPLEVREFAEFHGWPKVTIGTVDSSVDTVRLTFAGGCGVGTYRLDGPVLRSSATRRVFILDQSDGCLWTTAEAIRDGAVVERYEKPAAPRD